MATLDVYLDWDRMSNRQLRAACPSYRSFLRLAYLRFRGHKLGATLLPAQRHDHTTLIGLNDASHLLRESVDRLLDQCSDEQFAVIACHGFADHHAAYLLSRDGLIGTCLTAAQSERWPVCSCTSVQASERLAMTVNATTIWSEEPPRWDVMVAGHLSTKSLVRHHRTWIDRLDVVPIRIHEVMPLVDAIADERIRYNIGRGLYFAVVRPEYRAGHRSTAEVQKAGRVEDAPLIVRPVSGQSSGRDPDREK